MQTAAQESSLAEQVFQRYQELLLREDIYEVLPTLLIELKKPENQPLLTPGTIKAVLDDPDLLKAVIPDISDEFITLLKNDADIRIMLSDSDVQMLLQDPEAIDELAALIEIEQAVFAPIIYERYRSLFQREDIRELLPDVLIVLRDPEVQALLQPAAIKLIAEDPDHLKILVADIDDRFIMLLKEDADVKVLINDPDVHTLLQNPVEIDKLARLLTIEPSLSVVSITPASITSPHIGERFTISIDIANAEYVAGYQVTLQFDAEAVRYISWEQGTYLEGDLFDVPATIGADEITLASTAQMAVDATAGTLLTITFEVVAIKTSVLSLAEVVLASTSGVSLPLTTQDAEIVEPPRPAWDVNKDGVVNILDLTLVASNFGETGDIDADVNGDNVVNILDLTLVAAHFGE
ncbi:hypothetical protein F4Y93_14160 [Candidatus Poribacteria bacterium]|nr:hypothetical protein [Candidatus Poribacteria bacterium]